VSESELARVAAQLADLRARTSRAGLRAEALDTLQRRQHGVMPLPPALAEALPTGLSRGATVCVGGSVSLLLAMLGEGSAAGMWCAMVGAPRISAEAAAEYGIDLARVVVVPRPGPQWATVVGALLDAVDVVVLWPPARLVPGEVRRLMARSRARGAVLVVYQGDSPVKINEWPGAELRLFARQPEWSGAVAGYGRLMRRSLVIEVTGRGQAAQSRSLTLWLPSDGGGVQLRVIDTQPLPVFVAV